MIFGEAHNSKSFMNVRYLGISHRAETAPLLVLMVGITLPLEHWYVFDAAQKWCWCWQNYTPRLGHETRSEVGSGSSQK